MFQSAVIATKVALVVLDLDPPKTQRYRCDHNLKPWFYRVFCQEVIVIYVELNVVI